MPLKFTWKSIMGLLAAVGAPVTAATTEPHGAAAWVLFASTIGGWLVIAAERLADSKDFATVAGPGAVAELAKVKAQAAQWEALAQRALALAGTLPAAAPAGVTTAVANTITTPPGG